MLRWHFLFFLILRCCFAWYIIYWYWRLYKINIFFQPLFFISRELDITSRLLRDTLYFLIYFWCFIFCLICFELYFCYFCFAFSDVIEHFYIMIFFASFLFHLIIVISISLFLSYILIRDIICFWYYFFFYITIAQHWLLLARCFSWYYCFLMSFSSTRASLYISSFRCASLWWLYVILMPLLLRYVFDAISAILLSLLGYYADMLYFSRFFFALSLISIFSLIFFSSDIIFHWCFFISWAEMIFLRQLLRCFDNTSSLFWWWYFHVWFLALSMIFCWCYGAPRAFFFFFFYADTDIFHFSIFREIIFYIFAMILHASITLFHFFSIFWCHFMRSLWYDIMFISSAILIFLLSFEMLSALYFSLLLYDISFLIEIFYILKASQEPLCFECFHMIKMIIYDMSFDIWVSHERFVYLWVI